MDDPDTTKLKTIEFYAASVAAWYASALEHDKSVFALAAGGIALLITLLTTVGFTSTLTLALFVGAIASFLVTLIVLLVVFRKNQDYIERMLTSEAPLSDPVLRRLDRTAHVSFGLGVALAATVGISSAWSSFEAKSAERERTVANEKAPQGNRSSTFDSVNGAARMQSDLNKSFSGAGALRPTTASAPAQATPAPAPGAPAAPPASPPPANSSSGGK